MRLPLTCLLLLTSLAMISQPLVAAPKKTPVWKGSNWVWDRKGAVSSDSPRYLRRVFELAEKPVAAEIRITADNQYTLYVNGKKLGGDGAWESVEKFDIAKLLTKGKNVVAIEARNAGGPAAVIAWMKITGPKKKTTVIGTDASWRVSLTKKDGWEKPGFADPQKWARAVVIGNAGVGPWNIAGNTGGGGGGGNRAARSEVNSVADRTIRKYQPASEELKNFILPEGYEISLVVSEPTIINPVCIVLDEKNRLYVSESHTYRFGPRGSPVKPFTNPIVRLDPLPGGKGYKRHLVAEGFADPVMGMAIRDGKLWATANNYLYQFDLQDKGPATNKKTLIIDKNKAWNPFGMFVLEWGPDGKLYLSVGNHKIALEGPGGKMTGRGSSGIVVRMNADGTKMERLVHGLRVPYSFDYDPFGQLWVLSNGQGNPDRFLRVLDGVDYHCYSRGGINNGWLAGNHPLAPPCFELPRGASTQLIRYYGAAYPKEIQGSLLLNNWGAHGFHAPDRTIFRYVPDERNNVTHREPWITCKDPHFRSSHILLAPDGDLLISDWYGRDDESDKTGRVWKVSYTGKNKPMVEHALDSPKWKDQAYALSALGSPSHLVREKAIKNLAAQGPKVADALGNHAATSKSPLGAAGAIWAMVRMNNTSALKHLAAAAKNPDWRIRRLAANVARRYDPSAAAAVVAALADEKDPAVRVEAGLAEATPEKKRAALAAALKEGAAADQHLRYEAAWHLARVMDEETLLGLVLSSDENVRLAGLIAIDIASYEKFETQPIAQAVLARALAEQGGVDIKLLLMLAKINRNLNLVEALGKLKDRDDVPVAVTAQAIMVLRSMKGGRGAQLGREAAEKFLKDVRDGKAKPTTRDDSLVLLGLFESEGPSLLAIKHIEANLLSSDAQLRRAAHRLARLFGAKASSLSEKAWAALLDKKTSTADRLTLIGTLTKIEAKPDPAKWAKLLSDVEPVVVRDAVRSWRAYVGSEAMKKQFAKSAPALAARSPSLRSDLAAVMTSLGFDAKTITGAKLVPGDTSHANLLKLATAAKATKSSELLGRRVFERSACIRCHTTGRDVLLGPSLRGIGKAAKTVYLLEALLEPSKTIKTGYLTESIVTKDGKVLSGIVRDAPEDQLRIVTADKELLIDKADVEQRRIQKKSIMPDGQEKALSPGEFVDLVNYLKSLK
jgi:putative heme-binding domain-containing protein